MHQFVVENGYNGFAGKEELIDGGAGKRAAAFDVVLVIFWQLRGQKEEFEEWGVVNGFF